MIGQCRVADLGQPCRQGVDFAAGRAIDDTGFSAVPRQDLDELFFERCTGQCAVDQIRSIERSYELQRMLESELCGDVAPHAMGGSRGVGM